MEPHSVAIDLLKKQEHMASKQKVIFHTKVDWDNWTDLVKISALKYDVKKFINQLSDIFARAVQGYIELGSQLHTTLVEDIIVYTELSIE